MFGLFKRKKKEPQNPVTDWSEFDERPEDDYVAPPVAQAVYVDDGQDILHFPPDYYYGVAYVRLTLQHGRQPTPDEDIEIQRSAETLGAQLYAQNERSRIAYRAAERAELLAARRHRELIAAIERGNLGAQALDFAKDHPFLTGFIGANIVHDLKRK